MNEVIGRIFKFEKHVFARHADLYGRLATDGQSPKALMISCADSRIVPELILQAEPGDLFVTRNAGNIVPPFAQANGGVSSAVEYAVLALGVTDIIVCGHSGCGAMEALLRPGALDEMPNVAAWLRHSHAAQGVVRECYPDLERRRTAARAGARERRLPARASAHAPVGRRRHRARADRSARLVRRHPRRLDSRAGWARGALHGGAGRLRRCRSRSRMQRVSRPTTRSSAAPEVTHAWLQ